MRISEEAHDKLIRLITGLEDDRRPFWDHWRQLADYILPRRYVWLLSPTERTRRLARNTLILDPTGTTAAKVQASGMMNGITSPSRPWFRLRVPGLDENDDEAVEWLDEVTRRMLLAMAETNFYNALAVMYLDLVVFGTASVLMYEDFDNVFRCYNCPLGEYYLGQDSRGVVNIFAREFNLKVHQIVEDDRWGLANVTERTKSLYENNNKMQEIAVYHLIEPNTDGQLQGNWAYRETYWEKGCPKGEILSRAGFNELPGIFPRYEVTGNDSYGTSPAMDALPDIIQLQHETKKKAQALDKMVDPPIIADVQLQHKPLALLPRGVTFVAGVNNVGAKPIYTVQMPIDQLSADISDVQIRIREIFHNDLFKMISQLDTVRSATEIDARREEKLVLLGPVLERLQQEGLDTGLGRIFGIMFRADLFPEMPEQLQDMDIEIQYMSILTAAQTSVSTIPMERFIGLVGNVAPVYPKALNVPNWEELLLNYGRDLGVQAKNINSRDQIAALNQAQDELAQSREAAASGEVLVNSAKTLSETEVGGGQNALSRLINPFGG